MKLYAKVKKDGKWTFVRYTAFLAIMDKCDCECRECQREVDVE